MLSLGNFTQKIISRPTLVVKDTGYTRELKSKMAYTPTRQRGANLPCLFLITPSNSNWTKATDFLSWEILLSILLTCIQGAIRDSTKALKIITFGLTLSALFP